MRMLVSDPQRTLVKEKIIFFHCAGHNSDTSSCSKQREKSVCTMSICDLRDKNKQDY